MAAAGMEAFLECGPGNVLAGLHGASIESSPCAALGTLEGLHAALDAYAYAEEAS